MSDKTKVTSGNLLQYVVPRNPTGWHSQSLGAIAWDDLDYYNITEVLAHKPMVIVMDDTETRTTDFLCRFQGCDDLEPEWIGIEGINTNKNAVLHQYLQKKNLVLNGEVVYQKKKKEQ